jgi:hypothetical protein
MAVSPTPTPPRPISVTKGQFGFKVCPPRFPVNEPLGLGPDFVLSNRSGEDMRVTFPPGLVIDRDTGRPIVAPFAVVNRDKKNLKVNVDYQPPDQERTVSEVYAYEVFMLKAEIEASGCSRPEVEIQR